MYDDPRAPIGTEAHRVTQKIRQGGRLKLPALRVRTW